MITGSSRGWGRALAAGFARRGARVVVNGRIGATVDETVEAIQAAGGSAVGAIGDVATAEGAAGVIDTAVREFGAVDVLVNNAGLMDPAPLLTMTEAQWRHVVDVQLTGVFICTQLAARVMVEQPTGGRIIQIGGGAGVRGYGGYANHAASKGGLLAAAYSWALELADRGVAVNVVRGLVRTALTDPMIAGIRARLGAAATSLTDRELGFYDPDETVPFVAWLATAPRELSGYFFGIDGPKLTLWGLAQPAGELIETDGWTDERCQTRLPDWLRDIDVRSRGVAEISPAFAHIP